MTSKSVKLTIQAAHFFKCVPRAALGSYSFAIFPRESVPPSLQYLKFDGFFFKVDHCRALATLQRTDLKVELTFSTLEPQDAQDIFIEWSRHNQVVTELDDRQKNDLFAHE
jgi:hypothetical protein